MPEAETLHGLATGLGVPYSVVLQRALESTGYREPSEDYGVAARRGTPRQTWIDAGTGIQEWLATDRVNVPS